VTSGLAKNAIETEEYVRSCCKKKKKKKKKRYKKGNEREFIAG